MAFEYLNAYSFALRHFLVFPINRLPKLLAEVYRVSRHDVLISVCPKHIDSERLEDKMKGAGFRLEDRYSGVLIRDGKLESSRVLNS